jgi:hypothetical protein
LSTIIDSVHTDSSAQVGKQDDAPNPVFKGERMIALYNLFPENKNCALRTFLGPIVSTGGKYPEMDVTLRTQTGEVTIGFSTENLSMVVIGNLFHSLVVKGKRIQVDAYLCGSGGFLWANNFKALDSK